MKFKGLTQKEWEKHFKDTNKIFIHFCIFPILPDDRTHDNWKRIWFERCYKVSCWSGHGAGGNRYWKYFEKLNNAREEMENQICY